MVINFDDLVSKHNDERGKDVKYHLFGNQLVLNPITKHFEVISGEKKCYICSGNNFVDEHHIDKRHGEISNKTVPLCRRCHTTMHHYRGIHMFDDNLLDRAIEVWNMTQALYERPLMTKDKIVRSEYWLKKHEIQKSIKYDPQLKLFTEV